MIYMNNTIFVIAMIILYSFDTGIFVSICQKNDIDISNDNNGIIKEFIKTLYDSLLICTRGFFFYFYCIFFIINKFLKTKTTEKIMIFFKKIQNVPIMFIVVLFVIWTILFFQMYVYSSDDVVYIDDEHNQEIVVDNNDDNTGGTMPSNETINNLFRYYSSYNVSDINVAELHKNNNDVVAWLIVDNTSVNDPIVKTDKNDYYLSHDINKNYSIGGWTFMDYRNNSNMDDKNTIFYGHNLMNSTSFGGLSKVFGDKWFNKSNHKIVILNSEHKYTYEIFSVYYYEAETYYITTKFYTNDEYKEFLDTIKSRSMYKFNVSLDIDDKVITLSTCTDDNSGRKVIHARLVSID